MNCNLSPKTIKAFAVVVAKDLRKIDSPETFDLKAYLSDIYGRAKDLPNSTDAYALDHVMVTPQIIVQLSAKEPALMEAMGIKNFSAAAQLIMDFSKDNGIDAARNYINLKPINNELNNSKKKVDKKKTSKSKKANEKEIITPGDEFVPVVGSTAYLVEGGYFRRYALSFLSDVDPEALSIDPADPKYNVRDEQRAFFHDVQRKVIDLLKGKEDGSDITIGEHKGIQYKAIIANRLDKKDYRQQENPGTVLLIIADENGTPIRFNRDTLEPDPEGVVVYSYLRKTSDMVDDSMNVTLNQTESNRAIAMSQALGIPLADAEETLKNEILLTQKIKDYLRSKEDREVTLSIIGGSKGVVPIDYNAETPLVSINFTNDKPSFDIEKDKDARLSQGQPYMTLGTDKTVQIPIQPKFVKDLLEQEIENLLTALTGEVYVGRGRNSRRLKAAELREYLDPILYTNEERLYITEDGALVLNGSNLDLSTPEKRAQAKESVKQYFTQLARIRKIDANEVRKQNRKIVKDPSKFEKGAVIKDVNSADYWIIDYVRLNLVDNFSGNFTKIVGFKELQGRLTIQTESVPYMEHVMNNFTAQATLNANQELLRIQSYLNFGMSSEQSGIIYRHAKKRMERKGIPITAKTISLQESANPRTGEKGLSEIFELSKTMESNTPNYRISLIMQNSIKDGTLNATEAQDILDAWENNTNPEIPNLSKGIKNKLQDIITALYNEGPVDELSRLEYELSQLEMMASESDNIAEVMIANELGKNIKILPESAKKETGLKTGVGKDISSALLSKKDGVTVNEAAHKIWEDNFAEGNLFDTQDIRNIIIDVLSQGKTNYLEQFTNEQEIKDLKQKIKSLKAEGKQPKIERNDFIDDKNDAIREETPEKNIPDEDVPTSSNTDTDIINRFNFDDTDDPESWNKLSDQGDIKATPEQIKAAKEWWDNHPLSKIIAFEPMFNAVNSMNKDSVATFAHGAIRLYKGSDYTDLYHESFHAFMHTFLTAEQRDEIYAEIANLSGTFKTYKGDVKSFNEATRKEIEEFLAEKFREYVLSEGKKNIKGADKANSFMEFLFKFLDVIFLNIRYDELFAAEESVQKVSELFENLRVGNLTQETFSEGNMKTRNLNFGGISSLSDDAEVTRLSYSESADAIEIINSLYSDYIDLTNVHYSHGDPQVTQRYLDLKARIASGQDVDGKKLSAAQIQQDKKNLNGILNGGKKKHSYTTALMNTVTGRTKAYKHILAELGTVRDALSAKYEKSTNEVEKSDLARRVNMLNWLIDNYGDVENLANNKPDSNGQIRGVIAYHQEKSSRFLTDLSLELYDTDTVSEVDAMLKGREWNSISNEHSMQDLAKKEILFLIQSLHQTDNTGKVEYNDYGVKRLVDFTEVWNKIAVTLEGTLDADLMYQKLKTLSKSYPPVRQLLQKIGSPSSLGNIEQTTWSAFWSAFNLTRIPLLQMNLEIDVQDNERRVFSSKVGMAFASYKVIGRDWESKFQLSDPTKYIKRAKEGVEMQLDLDAVIKQYPMADAIIGKESKFLNDIGISITSSADIQEIDQVLREGDVRLDVRKGVAKKIYERVKALHKAYQKNKELTVSSLKDLIEGDYSDFGIIGTEAGNYSAIQRVEMALGTHQSNFMVQNAEGNSQFEHSLNNSLTVVTNAFNSVTDKPGETAYQELIKKRHMKAWDINLNPELKYNSLLNSMFILDVDPDDAVFGMRRDVGGVPVRMQLTNLSGAMINDLTGIDTGGVASAKADPFTKIILDFHLANNPIQFVSELMRHGDKSTSFSAVLNKVLGLDGNFKSHYIEMSDFADVDSNAALRKGTDYFMRFLYGEHARIKKLESIEKANEGNEDFAYDHKYLKNGQEFTLFHDIFPNALKRKLKTIDNIEEYFKEDTDESIELEDEVREAIETYLTSQMNDNAKLIREQGAVTNDLVQSTQQKIQEINGRNINPSEAKKYLTDSMTLNMLIHNVETMNLFYGNAAMYKAFAQDFHKRNSGIGSTGTLFRTDSSMLSYLNDVVGRKYTEQEGYETRRYDGTLHTAVVEDPNVRSSFYDQIAKNQEKAIRKELARNKPELKGDALDAKVNKMLYGADGTKENPGKDGRMHAYSTMDEADAQGLLSFDAYRLMSISQGEWNWRTQEKLYQALIKGENVDQTKLVDTFPPLKWQYWGYLSTEQNLPPVIGFHKYSLAPLIPGSYEKDGKIDQLHRKMMAEQIDYLTFGSASKVSTISKPSGIDKFYDAKTRTLSDTPFTKNIIHVEFLKNQLKTSTTFKGKVTFPTQLRKLIEDGLMEFGVPVDFETDKTKEERIALWEKLDDDAKYEASDKYKLLKAYEDHVAMLTEIKKKKLLKEAGIDETKDGLENKGVKLWNFVKKELTRQDLADHQIDFIEWRNGELVRDLSMSFSSDRIEKLLNAIVTKRLIKQKVHGEGLFQLSTSMFESMESSDRDFTNPTEEELYKYGSNQLPFYRTYEPKKIKIENFDQIEMAADAVIKSNDGDNKYVFVKGSIDTSNLLLDDKGGKRAKGKKYFKIDIIGTFYQHPDLIDATGEAVDIIVVDKIEDARQQYANYKKGGAKKFIGIDVRHKKTRAMKVKIALQGDFKNLFYLKHVDGNQIGVMDAEGNPDFNGSLARLNQMLKDPRWLNTANNREMITMVGVRIPVQGLNSMEFMEIAEFLPPASSNAIILPSEIVAKSGADFDIDKLTIMMPAISKTLGTPNLKPTVLAKLMKANPELNLSYKLIEKVVKKSKRIESLEELTEEENKILELITPYVDVVVEYNYDNKSEKGLENKIIQDMKNILEIEDNYASLTRPNGTDILDPIQKELRNHVNDYNPSETYLSDNKVDEGQISPTRIFEFKYNWYKHYTNNIGKQTLGLGAVDNTYNVLFNRVFAYLNRVGAYDQVNDLLLPHNKVTTQGGESISLSDIYDANGEHKISDVINQLLNGWVDIAKDAWVFNIQGNKEVSPQLLFLIQAGVPVRDAIISVSIPSVRRYVNLERKYKSTFSELLTGSRDRTFAKSKALEQILEEWYPAEVYKAKYDAEMAGKDFNPAVFASQVFQELRTERRGNLQTGKLLNIIKGETSQYDDAEQYERFAFLHYIHTERMAKSVRDIKLRMNLDTAESKSLFAAADRIRLINELRDDPNIPTSIIDELLKGSPIKSFAIQQFQNDLWSDAFPLKNHPVFTNFVMQMNTMDNSNATFGDNEKLIAALRNDLIPFIIQNEMLSIDLDNITHYKGVAVESVDQEATEVKGTITTAYAAVMRDDGVIQINPNQIKKEFKDKAWLNQNNEYRNKGLVGLRTYDEEGVATDPTFFRSLDEYARFVIEREYIRYHYPMSEIANTERFAQSFEKVKNNPKYFRLEKGDKEEWRDEKIAKLTYETMIRDMALDRTFNTWKMFYSYDSFAQQFYRIMEKHGDVLNKGVGKMLKYFQTSTDRETGIKNIKLVDIKLDALMKNKMHEMFVKLTHPNELGIQDKEEAHRVANFFRKFPIFAFMQTGMSLKGSLSLGEVMPQEILLGLMEEPIKKYTAEMDKYTTVDSKGRVIASPNQMPLFLKVYAMAFMHNNRANRSNISYRIKDYKVTVNSNSLFGKSFTYNQGDDMTWGDADLNAAVESRTIERVPMFIDTKMAPGATTYSAQDLLDSQDRTVVGKPSKGPKESLEPIDYVNHSGGAYGADTFWDVIGREFGVLDHRHYRDAENTRLSKTLKDADVTAVPLTQEQLDSAEAEINSLFGKQYLAKYDTPLKKNLQIRNYYQVSNSDGVFAIAKLNPAKTSVKGGTNTAVQLGVKTGKPTYVWDINTKQWHKFDGAKFIPVETPTLTKNFAGVGSRDIQSYQTFNNKTQQWETRKEYLGAEVEAAAKQAIRDVYEKTMNQSKSAGVKVVSAAYGVQTVETNPSKSKQKEYVELIKPQIQSQAVKENKGKNANLMFQYGLRWARVELSAKPQKIKSPKYDADKRDAEINKLKKEGKDKTNDFTYAYHLLDQNGNKLPEISTLQPIINEIQDSLGIDMSNYDAVIGNIYLPGQAIATHRDTTESESARNYPVVVYTIGAGNAINIYENVDSPGKTSFATDKRTSIPTKSGTIYTFGMDGQGRFEMAHDTPRAIKKGQTLEPITLPDGTVIKDYTITLTFRRAADLKKGMPSAPAKLRAKSTQPQGEVANALKTADFTSIEAYAKSIGINEKSLEPIYKALDQIGVKVNGNNFLALGTYVSRDATIKMNHGLFDGSVWSETIRKAANIPDSLVRFKEAFNHELIHALLYHYANPEVERTASYFSSEFRDKIKSLWVEANEFYQNENLNNLSPTLQHTLEMAFKDGTWGEQELITYAFTNKEFANWLKSKSVKTGKVTKSLWTKFLELIGIALEDVGAGNLLSKITNALNDVLITNEYIEQAFKDISTQQQVEVKEGVSDVFKDTPELASIGSEQDYSEYLEEWLGDSPVKDLVYRGTSNPNRLEASDINPEKGTGAKNLGKGVYLAKEKEMADKYSGDKGRTTAFVVRANDFFITAIQKNWDRSYTTPNKATVREMTGGRSDTVISFEYLDREDYVGFNEYTGRYIGAVDAQGFPTMNQYKQMPYWTQMAVQSNKQVLALGSKQDIAQFKNFMSKKTGELEAPVKPEIKRSDDKTVFIYDGALETQSTLKKEGSLTTDGNVVGLNSLAAQIHHSKIENKLGIPTRRSYGIKTGQNIYDVQIDDAEGALRAKTVNSDVEQAIDSFIDAAEGYVERGYNLSFSESGYGQYLIGVNENIKPGEDNYLVPISPETVEGQATFDYLSEQLFENFGYINPNWINRSSGMTAVSAADPTIWTDDMIREFMNQIC